MKRFSVRPLWRFLCLAALITASSLPAFAQAEPEITLTKVTPAAVDPPNMGSKGGTQSPDKWLEVEFQYTVTPKPSTEATAPGANTYVDEATFKVFVELRDMKGATNGAQGNVVVYTGEVTYINIPAGRDQYGVVYIPESIIERFGGSRDIVARKRGVRVEATVGGTKNSTIDAQKSDTDKEWMKDYPTVTGFVMTQDKTPFLVANTTRYPMIKPTK